MMGCVNLAATMERTDPKAAYALVEHACERGLPEGCFLQGEKLERGDGVVADPERGRALRARACDAGASFSCK
jgi:TPR repeat protein